MAPRAKPANEEIPAEIEAMSFEQALAALDEIVRRLEGGKVDLEDSIAIYTRGTHLRRHCEAKLRSAEERVEMIVIGAEGAVSTRPADIE